MCALLHTRRMSTLSKLKELKLYDNRIVSLAGLQGLSSLHTLDISSNCLTSLEVLAAECARVCTRAITCCSMLVFPART